MGDAVDSLESLKWAEFRLKRLEAAHGLHLKSIGDVAAFPAAGD
jgi:hypothetical protein